MALRDRLPRFGTFLDGARLATPPAGTAVGPDLVRVQQAAVDLGTEVDRLAGLALVPITRDDYDKLSAAEKVAGTYAIVPPTVKRPAVLPSTTAPSLTLRADEIIGLAAGAAVSPWTASVGRDGVVNTANGGVAPTFLPGATPAAGPAVRFAGATGAPAKMIAGTGSTQGDGQTNNRTYAAVVRLPVLDRWVLHGVGSGDAAASASLRLHARADGSILAGRFGVSSGTTPTSAAGVIKANTWHVVQVSFPPAANGAPVLLMVDGVVVATGETSSTEGVTQAGLALGGYGSGSNPVEFAEVRSFAGPMSAADLKAWATYLGAAHGIKVAA